MEMDQRWLSEPEVFQVNRLDATSSHAFYASREEMKEKNSSFIHCLNGTWKFHYAKSLNQMIPDFQKNYYDCSEWDDIQVPGHIQLQGYESPMYVNIQYPWSGSEQLLPGQLPKHNPVGSYVTYFDSHILKENTDTRIVFHGVESGMALWVNGTFVGYSEDSFTPSSFDITDCIREGKNKIAVNVYRFTSGSWLEDQDFWRFSGIFRDVELVSIPRLHINDLKITQDTTDLNRPIIHVQTQVLGKKSGYTLQMQLFDAQGIIVSQKSVETTEAEFVVNEPMLWYAERPYLYELVIEVKDGDEVVEYVTQKIGIRRFEKKDGIMYINGQRIVFHGVDRHEFCCEKGRVLDYATTKQDIENMKANNINAIRTSHYPNQNFFYDLCDTYGIYVIDETNLETHGTWAEMYDTKHIIPNDKQEWLANVLDRAQSMYERDKNHPCVLIWSCGNESYGGKDIYEMSKFFKEKDPSRLVHYEGIDLDPRYPDTTDMVSQMYTPASKVEEFLKQHTEKPFILCEYAHAMGNSNGALYKYTDLEKKYPHYQGGFIWDYVDQAILHDGKLYYGGDFGERPSDYDFCGNGIMFADRTATPKLQEVKYCYQYVDIDITEKNIHLTNRYMVTDLNTFDMVITLEKNGYVVKKETYHVHCAPNDSTDVVTPFVIPHDTNEYTLTVDFQQNGHSYAHEQKVFTPFIKETHVSLPVTITEDYLNIGVQGDGFHAIFSKVKGLVSYKVHGKEFIRIPLQPNFFRASTENDIANQYGYRYGQWLQNSLYAKCTYIDTKKYNDHCEIQYAYVLPTLEDKPVSLTYTVYGDGEVVVDMKLDDIGEHIEMPTFGLLFQTYSDLDVVDYYGNGPEENYIDRKKGALLSRYSYTVDENLTKYLYPQECGNRTETREFTVKSKNHSITVSGKPFEFSVLRYTPYEIENARHVWELPNVYETVICIHEKQMGIAGDNTWGAKTHPEFLLDKKNHHLRISIKAN